ncbi:hypothetical protein [Streptomyces hebeiensis]
MICPHCSQSLLYKERTGQVCSKCKRAYAFEPKTHPLGLHDLRIRRLVQKLGDDGKIKITVDQLWFAVTRKTRKARKSGGDAATAAGCAGCGVPVGLLMLVAGLNMGGGAGVLAFFGSFLLVAVVITVVSTWRSGRRTTAALPRERFRSEDVRRWKHIYGSLPDGVVEGTDAAAFRSAEPNAVRAALLCQDPSIAVFLAANGIPQRYGVVLVPDVRQVPDSLPVVVLHDADPAGCLLAGQTRHALPGRRVVDAGLPPRAVMKAENALPLQGPELEAEVVEQLRADTSLTRDEVDWLAKGWSTPLVGVPPARLLAVVTKVLERVTAHTGAGADADVASDVDPDRRKAASIGFLTWPGEAAR